MANSQSTKSQAAIKCVVSTAAHIALGVVQDENIGLWRSVLRDALTHCNDCVPAGSLPLFKAAEVFAHAAKGPPLSQAKTRLSIEARRYFEHVAAHSADRLESLVLSEGVR